MDEERRPANSPRLRNLIEKFRDKAYRDSYIASHTRRFLARQMRKFRGDKSQSEFGDLIGKRQTVVSRLEDSKYGKWTLQTLFDVAEKLNIAVLVRFVDIPTFLKMSEDMSEEASLPQAYDEDQLERTFGARRLTTFDASRLFTTTEIGREPIIITSKGIKATVSAEALQ
jgi:hypothetical protein